MKLNSHNKEEVIKLLGFISGVSAIDLKVYNEIQRSSGIRKMKDLGVQDFQDTLDMVYLMMVGVGEDFVYNSFECPAYENKSKKPVGWYKTQFNEGKKYPVSQDGFTGFIPDNINILIAHKPNINSRVKYDQLKRMFEDLIKLEKKNGTKKKKKTRKAV